MTTWFLLIHVAGLPLIVGGEYQTRERCEIAMKMQMPYWRKKYGAFDWACDVRPFTAPLIGNESDDN